MLRCFCYSFPQLACNTSHRFDTEHFKFRWKRYIHLTELRDDCMNKRRKRMRQELFHLFQITYTIPNMFLGMLCKLLNNQGSQKVLYFIPTTFLPILCEVLFHKQASLNHMSSQSFQVSLFHFLKSVPN